LRTWNTFRFASDREHSSPDNTPLLIVLANGARSLVAKYVLGPT
jgi:hypothetical protein